MPSGSMRSGRVSARPPLELPTGESGSSSSVTAAQWPTANTRDSADSARGTTDPNKPMHPRETLTDAIRQWPTPRTVTGGAESAARKQELGRTGSSGGDLQAEALLWTSPVGRDGKGATNENRHGEALPDQVATWQTPCAGTNSKSERAMSWEGNSRDGGGQRSPPGLEQQADAMWRTPHAAAELGYNPADLKDADGGPARVGKRGYRARPDGSTINSSIDLGVQAAGLAAGLRPSRQDQESAAPGERSSRLTPTSRRRLSPTFVEWLMNFPRGWTDPATWTTAPTASAPSATQSSPSKPASPSSSSGVAPGSEVEIEW